MDEGTQLTRRWIVYGVTLGVLADVTYASMFLPLPEPVVRTMAFVFGPLLSLSFVGFYHFFRLHRRTMVLQGATLFGIVAGTVVNLMLVVQLATHSAVPSDARPGLGLAWDGINMVQLGLDVSWDIYLSLATILLGIVMLGHPRFGTVWGASAILVSGGLLLFNLATFPIPPAEARSFDLGPAVGVLYLVVAVRILTSMKWVDERLDERTIRLRSSVGSTS